MRLNFEKLLEKIHKKKLKTKKIQKELNRIQI